MKVEWMNHTGFVVSNMDRSLAFYRDLLGAELRTEHQVRGVDVVRLTVGDFGIGLFDASAGDSEGVPHHTVSIDGPDDPEQIKSEIEGKGIAVTEIRTHRDGVGFSLYVNDPSGNRIELSHGEG